MPRRTEAYRTLVPIKPNAMEVFLLLLCSWSGVSGLVTWLTTGTVPNVRLHPLLAIGWLALLAVGGAVGVIGSFLPDRLLGGLVLRAALWPVAGGALTAGIGSAWRRDWSAAAIMIAFSAAAVLRGLQITWRNRDLKIQVVVDP